MPDTAEVSALDDPVTLASDIPLEPVPDEHMGHGGLYRLDPVTGKRELVERTQHGCC